MDQENILSKQLQKGDQDALFSIMLLYYNDLFRYALKFTADPQLTKELVNQFFIHIWDNKEKFFAAETIKPYIIVSFKRFLFAHYKKNKVNKIPGYGENELIELPYEAYIISLERQDNVRNALSQALNKLPKRQKQLVQLRFYEQLTYEEIAKKTSLTIRTIYNKLHEALKRLRSNELFEKTRD
jgi:RNA polymerase sigma-70 factor (ECF subfamily)